MRQDVLDEKDVVSETVRKLRIAYGETQQRFAERLGTALITITRWETSRAPSSDSALEQLEKLADEKGLSEYAEIFKAARTERIRPSRSRAATSSQPDFRNEEESRWCSALLRAMRNPDTYQGELEIIESALSRPLADIEAVLVNAQVVADVVKAISRLADQGRTQEEIARLFNLDLDDVGQILAVEQLKPWKPPSRPVPVREEVRVEEAHLRFALLTADSKPPKKQKDIDIWSEAFDRFGQIVPRLLKGEEFQTIASTLDAPIESVALIANTLGLEPGVPGSLDAFMEMTETLQAKKDQEREATREARRKRLGK